MRSHVRRGAVQDLQPELLELFLLVLKPAGHRQLDDVRDRVTGGEQCRLTAGVLRLLHDDPEVVRAPRRRPPRLLHQELGVHRRAARVLRCLRAPHPQPLPARCLADPARPLLELQCRRAREGLHALPAQLARRLRAGQQLLRGPVVLRVLHHVQDVQQILVGAGHADVQFLRAHEPVGLGVRGVRVARRDLLDHAAPAPQERQQHEADHEQRHQDEQNLHVSSEPDRADNWPTHPHTCGKTSGRAALRRPPPPTRCRRPAAGP